MKKEIHPKYFPKAKVTCSCGNTFEVGSTKEKIKIEICSACHPFYTGKQKLVDTARRVEKFEAKKAKTTKIKQTGKQALGKKKRRAIRAKKKQITAPKKTKSTIKKTQKKSPKK